MATLDFALEPIPVMGTISGHVTNAQTQAGIVGATITATGPQAWTTTTDASGAYTSPSIPQGTYTVTASAPGYTPQTKQAVV